MAQLLLINLPGYFPPNSPYAWDAFHVPPAGTPPPDTLVANPLAAGIPVCISTLVILRTRIFEHTKVNIISAAHHVLYASSNIITVYCVRIGRLLQPRP